MDEGLFGGNDRRVQTRLGCYSFAGVRTQLGDHEELDLLGLAQFRHRLFCNLIVMVEKTS